MRITPGLCLSAAMTSVERSLLYPRHPHNPKHPHNPPSQARRLAQPGSRPMRMIDGRHFSCFLRASPHFLCSGSIRA